MTINTSGSSISNWYITKESQLIFWKFSTHYDKSKNIEAITWPDLYLLFVLKLILFASQLMDSSDFQHLKLTFYSNFSHFIFWTNINLQQSFSPPLKSWSSKTDSTFLESQSSRSSLLGSSRMNLFSTTLEAFVLNPLIDFALIVVSVLILQPLSASLKLF